MARSVVARDSCCDDSSYLTVAIVCDVAWATAPNSTTSSYGTVNDRVNDSSGSDGVIVREGQLL